MLKIAIVLCAALWLALAEKPAPYPAKGWKPQGARLELPSRQYGVPQKPDEVEITTLASESSSNDENDVLRVQGLPAANAVSQFRNFQQQNQAANVRVRPVAARVMQMAPAPAFASQPILLSPMFAPQFVPVNGQLREMQFGRQEQVDPKRDVQQLPAQAYGPPQTPNNNEPEVSTDSPQPEDYDDDREESDVPAIAVSNAQSTGDLVQETQEGQVGQYYILLPDNSLQKVRFATAQTVEDRQINGFSAQLR